MSDKQKIDTDELITLYLDGQASQRQQTELKRLMLHDPMIADKLNALKKQQRLLNALPVETAPENLMDDIRAAMERKLILGDSEESTEAVSGQSHLMMRRLLTAAAMLLIPLGLLSAVVYQIIKPAPTGQIEYVPANERIASADSDTTAATEVTAGVLTQLPFNGVLVLTTDEYMTVSNLVEKAIFARGLISHTLPNRTADVTSFHITASPKMIADLVDSLGNARTRCSAVTLEVAGGADGQTMKIVDPKDRQIKMLVYEDNVKMLNHLAGRYAEANQKPDTLLAQGASEKSSPDLNEDGYPAPSVPTLAGSYDQINNATIQLSIHVKRNLK